MSDELHKSLSLMWWCSCGQRVFNHRDNCGMCGKGRPRVVPPDKPPSNFSRPDLPTSTSKGKS
jgi:hypothetical protein